MNTVGMLPPIRLSSVPDSSMMTAKEQSPCPQKFNLFGIGVSRIDYEEATALLIQSAQERRSMIMDHLPVHVLIEACSDSSLKNKINQFDIVAPDGHPVRWALNRLHQTNLSNRVSGSELMLRLCRQAEQKEIGVYLYGSLPIVLERLKQNLLRQFPSLRIVGSEAPPFRPLTAEEDHAAVARINQSGAGLIFLGLGCPKQEHFAFDHRGKIQGVQLCVGAAFDFIAGNKKRAPTWMQERGLEWLFRLYSEPRRLWRRYFVTNTVFLLKLGWELWWRKGAR